MKVYKAKFVSQAHSIVLVILLLTAFIGSAKLFAPHGIGDRGLALLIVALWGIVVYFAWQKFVTGRTEWTINDNHIHIVWTKPFVFQNDADITIKWDQVKRIYKGLDPNYYTLKIELHSGEVIIFYHSAWTIRDGFQNLVSALHQTFREKKSGK